MVRHQAAAQILGMPELLGLVQDSFECSSENRRYLAARLLRESANLATGEVADDKVRVPFHKRIFHVFYDRRGHPADQLDYLAGRKAISDYRKASGDLAGTLDLMLHYVETGTQFTLDFGDIDEPFYNSMCSMLNGIVKNIESPEGRPLYPLFRDRLIQLEKRARDRFGYGCSDYISDMVANLENRFGVAE